VNARRRNWIIVGSVAVAVVALGAWWLLFGQGEEESRNVPSGAGGGFSFFPISGGGLPRGFVTPEGEDVDAGTRIPTLRQLSETPTAGAIAYSRPSAGGAGGSAVYFRWVERATGHIFETGERDLTRSRISNTTVPSVQEAVFSGDAEKVLLRYLRPDGETIETALGRVKAVTTTTSDGLVYSDTKLETEFLEPGIAQVAASPDGTKFAKLSGGGAVSVAPFDGVGSGVSIFTSPLSEWNLSWPATGQISLTTKPAPGVGGYLFSVDPATGASEKVLEAVPGLVALVNPRGTRILYSTSGGGDLDLRALNLATGEDRPLELKGLPDKCAWSRVDEATVYCGAPDRFFRGGYPTNWYQGLISFTDNLWRIDVDTERYDFLFDSATEPQRFDAYRLTVSPNDEFLVFANKQDLTLWSLDLRAR